MRIWQKQIYLICS